MDGRGRAHVLPKKLVLLHKRFPHSSLYDKIEGLGLRHRKAIVKILRVRSNPNKNPFLSKQVEVLSGEDVIPYNGKRGGMKHIDVTELFDELESKVFPSDLLTSLTMMITRNETLGSTSWLHQEMVNRRESFYKELGASQNIRKPSTINYEALFGVYPDQPPHDYIPANPGLQRQIHRDLCQWKDKCSKQILFPKTSRKSMGVRSSYNAIVLYDLHMDYGQKLSTEDVEYWYWRTGEYPDGPCEMRQAWFYNDLTPRTYYATGCGVARLARYSQRIFNLLLDQFPFTHRFKRFRLDRIKLEKYETAVVYDYTSFTSLLHEHIPFVKALARFCRGTTIRVVDGPYGVVEWDLGKYLDKYAEECMELVEFEVAEELAEIVGIESFKLFNHQVASLLGINGNLASATSLHGIFLCSLCRSYEKCSCVGDDAIGVFECMVYQEKELGEWTENAEEKRALFLRALQTLGIVHSEKTKFLRPVSTTYDERFIVDVDRWTYLKRSLDRYPEDLDLGFLPAVPNIQVILQEEETTRRMNFDTSTQSLVPRVANQCFNLMKSIYELQAWDGEEVESSYRLLQIIYEHLQMPKSGFCFLWWEAAKESKSVADYYEHVTFLPAIGRSLEEFSSLVKSHPLEVLEKSAMSWVGEGAEVVVPELVRHGFMSESPDSDTIKMASTGAVSYACKVGVMSKKVVNTVISSDDLHDWLFRFVSKDTTILYEVTISSDCPDWLRDLLRG